MKEDEKQFFLECVAKIRNHGVQEERELWPRDLINTEGFPLNHKRAWFLLEKWSNRGLYDYGTTLDLGWITEKGNELAKHLTP